MKRTIKWVISVTLLGIQTVLFSQSFINDTKQWAIVSHVYDDTNNFTTNYKFSGDSIINGNVYHKLYDSNDSNQVNWHLNSLWWERNDSVFQHYSPSIDELAYDFNLQVGDTLHLQNQSYMKIDSIRLLMWGGRIRKFWFFNRVSTYGHITWIEGVGQWSGFNCPIGCINSCISQLLCFHENGNLVYHNPDFSSCYVSTSVPFISNSKELISLYPNPATTKLTIIFPENIPNATYTLYDTHGCIKQTGKTSNKQLEINVETLPRGIYVLKLVTSKQIVIKKIILQ